MKVIVHNKSLVTMPKKGKKTEVEWTARVMLLLFGKQKDAG